MKTSNAGLFSNQPDYFKYCWAIFHKRASVSTFLILQQSPQFIFEQLCKNPPCPSSEFPSYERYTAYSYFDKIDSYFDKIDFTYFSFRYLMLHLRGCNTFPWWLSINFGISLVSIHKSSWAYFSSNNFTIRKYYRHDWCLWTGFPKGWYKPIRILWTLKLGSWVALPKGVRVTRIAALALKRCLKQVIWGGVSKAFNPKFDINLTLVLCGALFSLPISFTHLTLAD